MKKAILAILPVLVILCAYQLPHKKHASAIIVNPSVRSRIDATLKSFVDSNKTAGLSALIFEKGKEVYYSAYGFADRERNVPMDRNTIVRIYSMTKPVTGVALMTLYEKGAFQLDDPLSKYAPEFADMKVYKGVDANGNFILEPAKRPITIRDITRHTAGFATDDNPALSDTIKKVQPMSADNTLTEMAKRIASLPLQSHPGDEWAYGVSVDVQAYLVEKLSGKPFDQYLKETIFDPLKMTNTWFTIPESEQKRLSALYTRNDDGTLSRAPDERANFMHTKEHPLKSGGWGLSSTLDDYMKFAQMLVNKGRSGNVRILKPETVQLMATNHLSDTISKRSWLPGKGRVGFGIDFAVRTQPPASKDENNGVVGEFFWDGAASTLFWVDPENELTAILFTQLFPFERVKLHKSFRDAVYGVYEPQNGRK
jgi:CubicO group peptidase (beta-lactamase class C family)